MDKLKKQREMAKQKSMQHINCPHLTMIALFLFFYGVRASVFVFVDAAAVVAVINAVVVAACCCCCNNAVALLFVVLVLVVVVAVMFGRCCRSCVGSVL
jgi:hypothetical protein